MFILLAVLWDMCWRSSRFESVTGHGLCFNVFVVFPESIQGNGGLESALCHCRLPPNASLFIIHHSTIGRYVSYNGNSDVFLLPSFQLKEASFTQLQALAFQHLFNNLGISGGERKIIKSFCSLLSTGHP